MPFVYTCKCKKVFKETLTVQIIVYIDGRGTFLTTRGRGDLKDPRQLDQSSTRLRRSCSEQSVHSLTLVTQPLLRILIHSFAWLLTTVVRSRRRELLSCLLWLRPPSTKP